MSKKGVGTTPTSQTPSGSGTIKEAFSTRGLRSGKAGSLTAEDVRTDKKQDITSLEDSQTYLAEDSPFHTHGESHSLSMLADSLFFVSRACKGGSASVTKTIVNLIRAIAFL